MYIRIFTIINYSLIKLITKFLFFNSIFILLSRKSLFFLWICLELNVIIFIPLVKKINNSIINRIIKYYIIQRISRRLFLVSVIFSSFSITNTLIFNFMILNSLWIKIGLFPYRRWYFQISENINWNIWFLLNTVQKIIPIWILSLNIINHNFLLTIILRNRIFSIIEIFNQTSLRWIINASSINHIRWIIIRFFSQERLWEIYFIIYFFISYCLVKFLINNNYNTLSNIINNRTKFNNFYFFMLIFNFLGVPPFLGFIPKIIILINTYTLFRCILLISRNIFISSTYFFYCIPLIIKNILNKQFKKTHIYAILNFINVFIFFSLILFLY